MALLEVKGASKLFMSDGKEMAVLRDINLRIWEDEKTTVVPVNHSVDEAISLADRIAIMSARPGRIKDVIEIFLP